MSFCKDNDPKFFKVNDEFVCIHSTRGSEFLVRISSIDSCGYHGGRNEWVVSWGGFHDTGVSEKVAKQVRDLLLDK